MLCEPLARLGAECGRRRSGRDQYRGGAPACRTERASTIDYRATTAEALADAGEKFDIVLAMEVVEHVADVQLFIARCAEMVKPGGLMVAATLNRTLKSFALAIVGAEYVLAGCRAAPIGGKNSSTPNELEDRPRTRRA